jgi:hypothetical protein
MPDNEKFSTTLRARMQIQRNLTHTAGLASFSSGRNHGLMGLSIDETKDWPLIARIKKGKMISDQCRIARRNDKYICINT